MALHFAFVFIQLPRRDLIAVSVSSPPLQVDQIIGGMRGIPVCASRTISQMGLRWSR